MSTLPPLQNRARYLNKSWLDSSAPPNVNLERMRHYRLNRIRQEMAKLDMAACVLVDPVNIRYATDTRNMQIFSARNPARYLFLPLDGPVVLFEFDRCEHLPGNISTIDEVRVATTVSYVAAAHRVGEKAVKWAMEIADLMQQYGRGNKRTRNQDGQLHVDSRSAGRGDGEWRKPAQSFPEGASDECVARYRIVPSADGKHNVVLCLKEAVRITR